MKRLGVGFIGSGFNARFHIRGWTGVRDGDVRGVWSPNRANADSAVALARELDVGPEATTYRSIDEMVADPAIDAIWLTGPNHARVENVEEIVAAIEKGATLRGIACEKPLARNVAEARRVVELVESVGLATGYLENQVFAPHIEHGRARLWARGATVAGRPYLARAAEEHSGPHAPWFWNGRLQGGGVLNDMMCHSALVVRWLLTRPGKPLATVRPVRVTGHVASLKWTRPEYAERLLTTMGVDYTKSPAEDFASVHIEFETSEGELVIGEATTSWSYVGPGLRLSAELLGPEYSMQWNSLDTGLNLFFSREVLGAAGEDLVEKQNAEVALMPVVPDEALAYGYVDEDRHFCRAFLGLEAPRLVFRDGLEVVQILMTAYKSAEEGRTLEFGEGVGVEKFVPHVVRGTNSGQRIV